MTLGEALPDGVVTAARCYRCNPHRVDPLDFCSFSISLAKASEASASCSHNRRSSGIRCSLRFVAGVDCAFAPMVGIANLHFVHSVVLSKLKLASLRRAQRRPDTTGSERAHACAARVRPSDVRENSAAPIALPDQSSASFTSRRQSLRVEERIRSQTPQQMMYGKYQRRIGIKPPTSDCGHS